MHYYSFHVSDYIHDTAHLSAYEDLAFRRMLDLYYTSEKPIPNKTQEVARRIRLPHQTVAVQTVLEEFFMFDRENDCWFHKRCDETIAAYQAKAERNREIGKLGGRPKANPKQTQVVSKDNPNHKPITINHKPNKNATSVAVVVPGWIPLETWEAFIQMRKRIGKPPTDYALKLIIAKLDRFRSNGQDVKQVLEKSITSGWQDVFEIKGNPADIVKLTVPPSKLPDPALEKIKEDDKKAAPIPLEVLAKMAQLRKGMQ